MRLIAIVGVVFFTMGAKAAAPSGDLCAIRGSQVTMEKVTIRPIGAKPFALGVREASVTARLPRVANHDVELMVEESISFKAFSRNVWLTVAKDFASADGLVTIRRGARLVGARVDGSEVVASAVLEEGDVREGEDKQPEEIASFVRVPCASLVLGAVENENGSEEPTMPQEWWKPKRKAARVNLFSRPKRTAPAIVVATAYCENCLEFKKVGEAGPWLLVERDGGGVTVRGWVSRAEFEQIPKDVGVGRSNGCHGEHGGGSWGEGWAPGGPPQNLYEGPALVQANANVFADPPRGQWAVFRENTPVTVRHVLGDKFVELRAVPGLNGTPPGSPWLNAHVAREHVVFPDAGVAK